MFSKVTFNCHRQSFVKLFNIRNVTRECDLLATLKNTRSYCSDVKKADESSQVVSSKDGGQDIERFQTTSTRPQKNVPFAKELFLGRFDKNMLVYPEFETSEAVDELNELVAPIQKYFEEGIDSTQIDIDAKIPQEVLQQLGELGLFGQQIPEEFGGLGLNATQYARLAEVTALDASIAVTMAAHQAIGLKGILIAGNDEQKQKYLPKLATGEHIAAFALTEPSSGSDAASIQTKATLSEDGTVFHLNGSKIWISNGGMADIFTVFAKTEVTNAKGEKENKVTAFIVERNFGGISNGKPEDKLGIRGSNTCEVYFDNTPVPVENVIGAVGGGFKIAVNILNSGRFSMGSSGAGMLKKLIGYTAEHATSRSQFKQKLSDFGLIQEKFAEMAVTTYAMESMAYLASQNIDAYEEPDMSVEAAMIKVYSSEGCWNCSSECLQVLGGLGYMKTYPYERYLRDARILLIFEGTNEILRMFIALTGVQYAGNELKGMIKKMRDPLNNPDVVWKAFKMGMRSALRPKSDPFKSSMTLGLSGEVHPTLKIQANILEECVVKFQAAVQELLKRHGNDIIHQQMDLKRLSDIAIDIYGMTACIGRTSRSICIGLKNADHERDLTRLFCQQAYRRIRLHFADIAIGAQENGDDLARGIASTIFENKGYAATHPLSHNY